MPVADGKEVLLVLVDSPAQGQAPFVCQRDGAEKLRGGAIYVRADGATREGNAKEIADLLTRAKAARPVVSVEVNLEGEAVVVQRDDDRTVAAFLDQVEASLMNALPVEKPPVEMPRGQNHAAPTAASAVGSISSLRSIVEAKANLIEGLNATLLAMSNEEPEKRTRQEYLRQIADWKTAVNGAWPEAVQGYLVYVLPAPVLVVTNHQEMFLQDVELTLHLPGDVNGFESYYSDDDGYRPPLKIPRPPRKWGPTKRDYSLLPHIVPQVPVMPSIAMPSSVSFRNSGSVDIEVDVGDLRPGATVRFDEDVPLLLASPACLPSMVAEWKLTARGHDAIYQGTTTVNVNEIDVTEQLRTALQTTQDRTSDRRWK